MRLGSVLPGGRGATITGRGAGVHRVLLSGAQACKTHFAFLHGTGGLLFFKGSAFAKEADELLRKLAWKRKGVATKMQVRNGIYVFPLEDGKKGGLKGESRASAASPSSLSAAATPNHKKTCNQTNF